MPQPINNPADKIFHTFMHYGECAACCRDFPMAPNAGCLKAVSYASTDEPTDEPTPSTEGPKPEAMTRLQHLSVKAMEECGEIAQRISKALRFGFDEVQPGQFLNNRERIRLEFGNLVATLNLIDPSLTAFSDSEIDQHVVKFYEYLQYSEAVGLLRANTVDGESLTTIQVPSTPPPNAWQAPFCTVVELKDHPGKPVSARCILSGCQDMAEAPPPPEEEKPTMDTRDEEIKALRDIVRELRNALEYYADDENGWELVEHANVYEESRELVPDDEDEREPVAAPPLPAGAPKDEDR